MKCPRCDNRSLVAQKYESVEVDRCPNCNGTWLDAGEIKIIIDTVEEKFSEQLISLALKAAATGVSDHEKKSLELCPKCSSPMNPLNFNYSSGVIIDVCQKGHGIWFDKNELDTIQAHMEQWNQKLPELKKTWSKTLHMVEAKDSAAQKEFDKRIHKQLGPIGDLAYYVGKKLMR